MTLVETMSPPVTPSVDCVLNRNGGRDAGPRPELCSIIGRAKSKANVRGKDEFRWAPQRSESIPGAKDSSTGTARRAVFTNVCCMIIFNRLQETTGTFSKDPLTRQDNVLVQI